MVVIAGVLSGIDRELKDKYVLDFEANTPGRGQLEHDARRELNVLAANFRPKNIRLTSSSAPLVCAPCGSGIPSIRIVHTQHSSLDEARVFL